MSCDLCYDIFNCSECSERDGGYYECHICGHEDLEENLCDECGEHMCKPCESKINSFLCVECYDQLVLEGFIEL